MPITSLSGFVTLPELKLNFVINLNEEEPKRNESKVISRILDMASDLSPEMQEIIADFADFLAKKRKPNGQDPT